MQAKIEKVCNSILKQIKPKRQEQAKMQALAEKLEEKVSSASRDSSVEAEVRLEGSVAKDTWISGDPDIDIFMRVSKAIPRKFLGEICLKIAKKATEGSKQIERFAEHPYLEATVNDTRVNIVPCYTVKQGEWLSATDRTPFHTDYVRENLEKQMKDEVRLLKQFMKGIDVYGAEIKIGGFSGYLSELLILHYKSFLKTLMAFSKYENGIIIDIENYYREREDELELLFKEPLIVVDPVDRGRNVASAVRPQKLYTLVAAARAFLRKPNAKFFYPPKIIPMTIGRLKQELARRGPAVILLIFGRVKAVSDVLWGQLYKSQRSLRKQIQLSGFNVLRDTPWSDEETMNMFIFKLEQRSISPVKKHIGPPLQKLRACERFLQKHVGNPNAVSGPYIEGGKWVVEILRRHTDVVGLLKEKLKDGGRRAGVAEHISRTLGNTLKIYVDKEIVDVYGENIQFAEFFTEFLSGRPKWLEDHNRTNNVPSVQQ